MQSTHTAFAMEGSLVRLCGFENLVPKQTEQEHHTRGDFLDVTLVCGDGQVQAQRHVLEEASNVFREMLETKTNVRKLQITGVLVSEMENILNLVHYGETVLPKEAIATTLKKGNILGFNGFDEEEVKLLEENPISSGECLHPEPDLEEVVIETRKKPNSADVKIKWIRQPKQELNANKNNQEPRKSEVSKLMETSAGEPMKKESNPKTEIQLTFMDVMTRNSFTRNKDKQGGQCNICRKMFVQLSTMKEHMKDHFTELPNANEVAMKSIAGVDQWQCLPCGRIDASHHIREHVEIHVPGLQYKCPKCGAKAKTKNSLRSHMSRVCSLSTKKRDKRCNMCSYTTHDDAILYQHWIITHSDSLTFL